MACAVLVKYFWAKGAHCRPALMRKLIQFASVYHMSFKLSIFPPCFHAFPMSSTVSAWLVCQPWQSFLLTVNSWTLRRVCVVVIELSLQEVWGLHSACPMPPLPCPQTPPWKSYAPRGLLQRPRPIPSLGGARGWTTSIQLLESGTHYSWDLAEI